jgi:hypothetical protein
MKTFTSETCWRALALVCGIAAVIQNLLVVGRIAQIATLAWKIDLASSTITAGSTMLVVFFGATLGCWLLAWLVTTRLLAGDIFRRISHGSMFAFGIGACIWGVLLYLLK